MAMRGARAPQALQALQDLPHSLALIDRVSMWRAVNRPVSLRVAHTARSCQLGLSRSCQCSWSSGPTRPPRTPRSHGRLCWGKCPVGQGLSIWRRGGEADGMPESLCHQSTGGRDQNLWEHRVPTCSFLQPPVLPLGDSLKVACSGPSSDLPNPGASEGLWTVGPTLGLGWGSSR